MLYNSEADSQEEDNEWVQSQNLPCFFLSQNCYLLSVICNAKNSFSETVNCQTVTLAIDIGFALMMSEMYVFCPYTMLGK